MRLKLISCEAFAGEIIAAIRRSVNKVDAQFIPNSLHPFGCSLMRERIQDAVEAVEHDLYQAVLLANGLCHRGIAGLRARTIPLVIPRALPGAKFWEEDAESYAHCCRPHAYGAMPQASYKPLPHSSLSKQKPRPQDYAHAFGSMDSPSVSQAQAQSAPPHKPGAIPSGLYSSTTPETAAAMEAEAHEEAEWFGWDFESGRSTLSLVQRFVDGYWGHHEFVVVPPGWKVIVKSGNEIFAKAETSA
jgi:hypothetical protein